MQEEAQAAGRPDSGGWRSGRGRNASLAASPRDLGSSPSQVTRRWHHAMLGHGEASRNSIGLVR